MPNFRVEFDTLPQWHACPVFTKFEYQACGINHGEAIAEELLKVVKTLVKECDNRSSVSAILYWTVGDDKKEYSRKVEVND